MPEAGKISGIAIAVATIGGLVAYAGFQGKSPTEILKDLSSGKAPGVSKVGYQGPTGVGTTGIVGASYTGGSALVGALGKYQSDKYSQAKRAQSGYSDCSSFVGKGLKDIGVKVPGGLPITTFYMVWTGLTTINKADIQAGDLLCATGHMAVAIGGGQAVGQQNSHDNVRVDTIQNIMYGTTWIARRLKSSVKSTGTASI